MCHLSEDATDDIHTHIDQCLRRVSVLILSVTGTVRDIHSHTLDIVCLQGECVHLIDVYLLSFKKDSISTSFSLSYFRWKRRVRMRM